jgi:large-conductance mechanosensitive channel
VIPLAKETLGEQYSYLTNAIVEVHWTLGMGSVLKPILNFILLATLLYEITQLPQDAENNSIA